MASKALGKLVRRTILVVLVCGTGMPAGAYDDRSPSWSPDGARIAFESDRDGSWAIYVMNADGSDMTQVTRNPGTDYAPTWSPDGARIAFGRSPDGELAGFDLFIVSADGTSEERIVSEPGLDMRPFFSPDGRKLAFNSDRTGARQIYVLDLASRDLKQLTQGDAHSDWVWWSQATDHLFFESNRDGQWEVYSMTASGADQTRLTFESGGAPAVSADGKRIAFQSKRDGDWEIFVMNLDGSSLAQLTSNDHMDRLPAWRPDSSLLAFSSDRSGDERIYSMAADGSQLKLLSKSAASD